MCATFAIICWCSSQNNNSNVCTDWVECIDNAQSDNSITKDSTYSEVEVDDEWENDELAPLAEILGEESSTYAGGRN